MLLIFFLVANIYVFYLLQSKYILIRKYKNIDDVQKELRPLLKEAKSIKLLTYLSEMHKSNIFYDSIVDNEFNPTVKILICSEHSFYVSRGFAEAKNKSSENSDVWKARIQETKRYIKRLQNHHNRSNIQSKEHELPFVWDLWIVDDSLFITAKLFLRGMDNKKLPVYKIRKSKKAYTLFNMFERYFEREWNRSSTI